MQIIEDLYNSKEHMPDLQIKEISLYLNKIYLINIQTISSSKDTNDYILNYLSDRSIFKNNIFSLKKDLINNIPSISFIQINGKELYNY